MISIFIWISCCDIARSQDAKRALDEKVRYLEVPREGEEFGLVSENRIRYKFEAAQTYDDNIFLTKDNVKYDLITVLSPGVAFYRGNSDSLYYASYEADILIHAIHNNQTRVNQDIEGRVELLRNSIFHLRAGDSFRPTTDPATSETNDYVKRLYNSLDASLVYDVSEKTALELNYEQLIQHYISESYREFSYIENIVSPTFLWKVSTKTSLSGEYNLGVVRYYEGADYDSVYHQARAGIQGNISPKSTINLKGGYQYRIYDADARKTTKAAVLEGIYNYKASDKTTLEFIASRSINESVYEDVAYYKTSNAYLSAKHNLTNNLELDLAGFYIRNDYPKETLTANSETKNRSDNIFGFNTKLECKFRAWLVSYVMYEFKIRDSNMRDFQYKDARITCAAKMDF